MTSVVLVDTGGRVVECVAADEDAQQVGCTKTRARVTLQLLFTVFSPFRLIEELSCLLYPLSSSITLPRRRESVRWT